VDLDEISKTKVYGPIVKFTHLFCCGSHYYILLVEELNNIERMRIVVYLVGLQLVLILYGR
jgi:hypothetical protein